MQKTYMLAGAIIALAGASQPVLAQRTAENAATKAEDAFGTSIGGEQIGIYNPNYVRGFSAVEAGNVRLNGLYFDQQGFVTDRIIGGLQMRVGLSAQSYPFPAPTGIADYQLRLPGDEAVLSTVLRAGPFGTLSAEADGQLPVTSRLSIGLGASIVREKTAFGGTPSYWSGAVLARWRPADGIEVTPFYSRTDISSEEPQPLFFTSGDHLPPIIPRERLLGQSWARNQGATANYGVLGRAETGDWTVRAGVFRSVYDMDRSFSQLFLNLRPDGTAQEAVIIDPERRYTSTSGELRVSRRFAEGNRLHSFHASLRGRDRSRLYGGGVFLPLGTHPVGTPVAFPEPAPAFGPRTTDQVRQWTGGLAYELRWRGLGELSLGVQHSNYRKSVIAGGVARPDSTDSPWLLNATAALYVTPQIALYGGYTRGLEESPVAPDTAVNKDEAPPAIRTRQVDAGVRWAITPRLRFVAGLFEVEKPYFNLNASRVFGPMGTISHRGAEFSLTGQVVPGLTAVLGTVLMDATLSGPLVEAGQLGRRPISSIGRVTNALLEYRPPSFQALSVDLLVESTSERVASNDGRLVIPERAIASIGGRYRFQIGRVPATLRSQVSNIFDNYGFANGPSGLYVFNLPRRFSVSLATDL